MTPSSAATTRTTTSVTIAPLARMAENAACPGVSRKVIILSLFPWEEFSPFDTDNEETGKVNAPMCCVMPPASPVATLAFRSVSRSVVFPWSTCPIMVTTGGRGGKTDASAGRGLLQVNGQKYVEIVEAGRTVPGCRMPLPHLLLRCN